MKKKTYIWTFCALLIIYVVLSLTLPSDPKILERYDMTQTEARLISLSIVLPISAIYLSALYGFIRFDEYANRVAKSKEGPHFKNLAKGLMVLAFTLPVMSVIGSLLSYVRSRNDDLVPALTIFRGYMTLILAFVAIFWIAKGAQGLFSTLKNQKTILRSRFALLGPIALAGLFSWFITSQGSSAPNDNGYYLPDWLLVISLALPYTFIWCEGIKAAFQLNSYQASVKGIIFKRAFKNLSVGLGIIIGISISIQLITTMSEQLNRLNLTPLLAIVYVLIAMYAVAYGLVARGSKKLKQIEEA